MSALDRPLVSFVVPTLNRGRYVVRAVESCLNADTEQAGVDIEVIVLDSQSDDGSWQALQERFASDRRVTLVQNRRGLGPTRSWLDGARLAKGAYITFLWSDDYIAPQFLSVLVPGLHNGEALSVGRGLMRDLDNDTPLPAGNAHTRIDGREYLAGYFRRRREDNEIRPVSPACCLFSRAAFFAWIDIAEAWCQATPLRQNLLWRRAIGPDLLLFLVALRMTPGEVMVASTVTAQFSHHPDSFSVAASRWSFETGYWLARLWYPCSTPLGPSYSAADFVSQAGLVISYGLYLAATSLCRKSWKSVPEAAAIISEVGLVWTTAISRGLIIRVINQTALEIFRMVGRVVRRAKEGFRGVGPDIGPRTALQESIERAPDS